MLTLRIGLLTIVAVVLAACGSALAGSDDVTSSLPGPDAEASTTTIPLVPDIEDPPLPTAPPTTPAPDTVNDDADHEAGDTEVSVFLLVEPNSGIDGTDVGCGLATAVTRLVQSPNVLSGAVEALLSGPTADEQNAGYGSVFASEFDWELASVTIADGVALVDFADDTQPIPNMSASCMNMALMAQLEMTATQFPNVERAVFSVGGDVATFYHWLERDVPEL